jgi:hypothetical protein
VRFSERGPRLRVERARARPEVHNLNTHAAMTHASIMHACVAVAGSNHYSFHLRAQLRSIFAVRVAFSLQSRVSGRVRERGMPFGVKKKDVQADAGMPEATHAALDELCRDVAGG